MENDAGGNARRSLQRLLASGVLVLTVGVGGDKEGTVTGAVMPPSSTRELARGPVAPAPVASSRLVAPIRAVPRPQADGAPVPVPLANAMVDARLLVIATDGQESELAAIEDALQF